MPDGEEERKEQPDNDITKCGVCQELNFPPMSLVPCGHSFCGVCIHRLKETNSESHQFPCPFCRQITVGPAIPNVVLQQVLESERAEESEKRRREWREITNNELGRGQEEDLDEGLRRRRGGQGLREALLEMGGGERRVDSTLIDKFAKYLFIAIACGALLRNTGISFSSFVPSAPYVSSSSPSSSSFFSGSCEPASRIDVADYILVTDDSCFITISPNQANGQLDPNCKCEVHYATRIPRDGSRMKRVCKEKKSVGRADLVELFERYGLDIPNGL